MLPYYLLMLNFATYSISLRISDSAHGQMTSLVLCKNEAGYVKTPLRFFRHLGRKVDPRVQSKSVNKERKQERSRYKNVGRRV